MGYVHRGPTGGELPHLRIPGGRKDCGQLGGGEIGRIWYVLLCPERCVLVEQKKRSAREAGALTTAKNSPTAIFWPSWTSSKMYEILLGCFAPSSTTGPLGWKQTAEVPSLNTDRYPETGDLWRSAYSIAKE